MMELKIIIPGLEELARAIEKYAASCGEKTQGEATPASAPPVLAQPAVSVPVCPAPTRPAASVPVDPMPTQPTPPVLTQTVPTTQTTYKMDDLSVAAIRLIESGKLSMEELQQIMASFGVASLPELPETQYGTFATILRQKGANI